MVHVFEHAEQIYCFNKLRSSKHERDNEETMAVKNLF